jgi:hypothetical protein
MRRSAGCLDEAYIALCNLAAFPMGKPCLVSSRHPTIWVEMGFKVWTWSHENNTMTLVDDKA